MKKFYVYIKGEKSPYIIRAKSKKAILDHWNEGEITEIIEGE